MIQTCEHIRMFLWQHSAAFASPRAPKHSDNRDNFTTHTHTVCKCPAETLSLIVPEEPSLLSGSGDIWKDQAALCAFWYVRQRLSICLFVCVYIHKQALLLPEGQDVSVASRNRQSTAELNSDKQKQRATFVRKLRNLTLGNRRSGDRTCWNLTRCRTTSNCQVQSPSNLWDHQASPSSESKQRPT